MPIYEYECGSCGKFEVMQKMSEKPLKTCEKCGAKVKKLVSLSSFALVGGGWYKDLYGSTNPNTKSSSEEPNFTKAESKPDAKAPESKADSKTEPKAESKTESKASEAKAKPEKPAKVDAKPPKATPAAA